MSGESPGTAELLLNSVPAPCNEPLASSPPRISGQWSAMSKVSGSDVSKLFPAECEGTDGSKKVWALACWTQDPQVNVAAVKETNFIWNVDSRVLENDLNVFSAYSSRSSTGVSLLVGRSHDAYVEVVFAGDGGRLVVAEFSVTSFKFRLVVVYVLRRGFPFFVGWRCYWTIRSGYS